MLRPGVTQQLASQTQVTASSVNDVTVFNNFDFDSVVFELNVTNASGTNPTLDVYIQTQDTSGNWIDAHHFVQITASNASKYYATCAVANHSANIGLVGSATISAATAGVPLLSNNVRSHAVIGGTTPMFSYSIVMYFNHQNER
ncbi:MAG: hypothetical protein KGI50_08185 [Patescibacteria group bacterium]|nr:hypothetical protein [Patescibacteria group bacterium]MDE2439130.1 hypothetical protein [Patescibacteria group bacterium]